MPHWKAVYLLLLACVVAATPATAERVHGIAMHGSPKHPAGFTHFPYANPSAPKAAGWCWGRSARSTASIPSSSRASRPGNLRDYVYESLMARSGDEPFTLYGLIAESVEVPEDRSSITFHLRPEARFSDGVPITPEDVLFSHTRPEGEGLALSPLALWQGGHRREDRPAQCAFHFRDGRATARSR